MTGLPVTLAGNGLPVTLVGAGDDLEVTATGSDTARTLADIAAGAAKRLQIISGGGGIAAGTAGGSGDSDYTNADSRIMLRNGLVPATNIRFLFGNFIVTSGAEADGADDITVRAAIELPGTSLFVNKAATFNGSDSVVIGGKANLVASDPIGVSLAAGQLFTGRLNCQVTSGDVFPVHVVNLGGSLLSGDPTPASGFWTANAIKNTGATNVYGVSSYAGSAITGFGPTAVLGEVAGYAPAVVIYGDSIARGSGDGVSAGLMLGQKIGYIARGLRLADDRLIPSVNAARDGETITHIAGEATAAGIANSRRWSLLGYATHVVFQGGSNDIVGAPTLAYMQAAYLRAWGLAKQQGVKVAQCLIMPRTSGTYTSAGGQTIASGFGVGELRDQVNDWIETQVGGGLLDYVIDPNEYVEDPAAHGKWISTGSTARTADGVHPNAQGVTDAAQAVRAWAEIIAAGG